MSNGLRFGIGARVFLAFGAIVAGTVVSGVAASLLLTQVGGLVRQVGTESVPGIVESLELRASVGTLLAAVPSLARSESETQRSDEWSALEKQQADVTANNADDQALLRRFAIFGPPTIAFFDSAGTARDNFKLVGFVAPEKFREHVASLAAL